MTKKQKSEEENVSLNSCEKFIDDFSVLHGAAVGVVVVRTREPSRFSEALLYFAQEMKLQFRLWKCTDGWNTYNMRQPDVPPTADKQTAIVTAVDVIGGNTMVPDNTGITNEKDKLKGSVFAMMWPHWYCNAQNSIAEVTQYIADYARSFCAENKRLVLIVPPEYQLPIELQDCVVIIDTDLPAHDELMEAYDDMVQAMKELGRQVNYNEDEVYRILSIGAGMTVMEFETAISRAFRTVRKRLPNVPIEEFLKLISKAKAELIKRSEVLELMPLGSMEDVGGLENLKEWIEDRKVGYLPEAREFGVDKPKGTALIGPPGTGKTLCAKACAHSLGLPLIKFDVSRVFNQFVGSSESRVREALKFCAAMAPCVVLVDEVDKAFDINSGGGDSGVGKRVLGAILTFMQETEKDIFWVLTANRVGGLPPELLRKGRLDEVFSVSLPNEEERLNILKIHLRKRKQNPDAIKGLEAVAERCSGFVGAEIEAAVSEAVLIAFKDKTKVTAELLSARFEGVKPLSEAHADNFNAMRDWAEQNARAASKGGTVARDRGRSSSAKPVPVGRGKRSMSAGDLDG